ncbi:membrane fusion protein, multidrug efflux system [Planctomicrobium piriforme]|uniref:Membrane fusion protein, multidrug efflux system n=2 Tax=Planctomicrobium piriforme TaxID=1576369 RepID=A0A1I3RAH0_9PLAN|nr:membrane fusion protein, multidrug efflux system [Planctomicrobium piriforme]
MNFRSLEVVLFFVIVISCSGCAPEVVAEKVEPPKVTVQHPVMREVVDYKDYNGTTAACATVEVRSRVRGHVDKVAFVDGQDVKEGDVLFELDPRPFQLAIASAKEELKLAQAQQEGAIHDEDRQKSLFEKSAGTKSDLDKAIAMRKSWDARIEIAREEIKSKELDLAYSTIKAPIAGLVSRALLTQGNLVNAGGSDPVMTTIIAIDPIYVYFNVDERTLLEYRDHHRAGQPKGATPTPINVAKIPFQFGLETDEGYPNAGELDFAENRIDSATGTIEVRGTAPNADRRYVPGSRLRVRVAINEPYQATIVPDTAILSDQDRKYLLCLNQENVVIRRDVSLGKLLDDGMRVIRTPTGSSAALNSSDWVIVNGLQRARVNYPVQPMDTEGKALAQVAP